MLEFKDIFLMTNLAVFLILVVLKTQLSLENKRPLIKLYIWLSVRRCHRMVLMRVCGGSLWCIGINRVALVCYCYCPIANIQFS